MKPFIAVLLILLCTTKAKAQHAKLDSLDRLISKSTSDTARIKLLLRKISLLSNIDSAISLGKTVIEETKKINYRTGEAEARQKLASKYNMKGDYQMAAENFAIAESIYKSLKDSLGLNYVWSGYGMMYGMQSKYDTSTRYFEAAIGIAERNGYTNELSNDYGNIAIGYQMQSNFSKALHYQLKALALAKANNDIDDQAYVSLNIGQTYFSMGDTARAGRALFESINFAKIAGDKNVELYAYSNLADLYNQKNQPQKAYDYAMKAASLGKEVGDQGIQAASLSKAARSLTDMKKFTEAEITARQAISVADSSGQPLPIYQAYSAMGVLLKTMGKYKEAIPYLKKSITALHSSALYDEAVGLTNYDLSLCYEKTGDYNNALTAYKTGSQILDSVRSRENIRKATELNMNYEHEKKQEAQRIEQKQKDEITKERQIALLIGLGLMLILAIVAFGAFRNKQKANAILTKQKQEIQNTLVKLEATQKQLIQSEKMASLGELTAGIAHEIQNPLNFVNNFSEVSNELIGELKSEKSKPKDERDEQFEDELLNDIHQNLEKINHHGKRADAIVKGMLQHSRSSSGVKEPTDINALCDEYLRLAYHGLRAKDKSFNAKFETDFDPTIGKINIIPQDIGRVILNLLNNAFYAVSEKQKHALASSAGQQYEPTVTISSKKAGSRIEITVKDNGNGIPQKILDKIFQPFFTTKPTGQGTGLGLSLAYDIVTKGHGGELKAETKEGEGSTFIINLPII
jgi:two-component system, NtrC family, sensor kinase